MLLEFIPANQDLKDELAAIVSVADPDPLKALSARGKLLRGVRTRWENNVSNGFKKELDAAIQLTLDPPSGQPIFPDFSAYDSEDSAQMKEFAEKALDSFNRLKDWENRKKVFDNLTPEIVDPQNRYYKSTMLLNSMLGRFYIPEEKVVTIKRERYILRDGGEWPGHIVCKIRYTEEIDAKKFESKVKFADVPLFLTHLQAGEPEGKKAVIDNPLLGIGFTDLRKMCKEKGIPFKTTDKKADLIELLLKGSNDTKGT
jgi:hypothetical protein